MIIHTAESEDKFEIAVWMKRIESRPLRHRHDLVFLTVRPETGEFICEALTDIGQPVLQPQVAEIEPKDRIAEIIQQAQANRAVVGKIGSALAAAAFLRLTGLTGSIPGKAGGAPTDAEIVARFESFLNQGAASPPPADQNP